MIFSGRWVTLKSARGYTFQVYRRRHILPKIPPYYLDCSIYLYDSKRSAEDGENFGGSGCLVAVHPDPIWDRSSFVKGRYTKGSYPPAHIYAVTNKHLAMHGFPVIRLNTIDDKHDVLELEYHDWTPHPDGDDLAIAPITLPGDKHNYFAIPTKQFLGRRSIEGDVGAGDDTFMVGRFVSHAGQQRNTPSLRFGSIAMLPFEKVKLGEAANYHMQEAFLVETRSISGYSGSPVFVYQPVEENVTAPGVNDPYSESYSYDLLIRNAGARKAITELVGHLGFLGIDCGHVPKYEKIVNGAGTPHPQGWKVPSNTGMAVVIPAWRLLDLLNKEEFVMQRKVKDEEYKKEKESEESVIMDMEKPESFTKESYQDALRRASRKVSEPKSQTKKAR